VLSDFAHVPLLLVREVFYPLLVVSFIHSPDTASDEDEGDATDDNGEHVEGVAVGGVPALDKGICGIRFDRKRA
jgi:hypothetical protein